jgi:hypothetical protein
MAGILVLVMVARRSRYTMRSSGKKRIKNGVEIEVTRCASLGRVSGVGGLGECACDLRTSALV